MSNATRSPADLCVQQQRVRAVLREQQVLQLRERGAGAGAVQQAVRRVRVRVRVRGQREGCGGRTRRGGNALVARVLAVALSLAARRAICETSRD